jgi:hypothetical protein
MTLKKEAIKVVFIFFFYPFLVEENFFPGKKVPEKDNDRGNNLGYQIMKVNQICKRPDDSFVETESHQADNREYQEFHLLACQGSSGKNPENAQSVVCQKTQDEGDGR